MGELTIIIPTYNRIKELKSTLEKLIPQLKNEKVVVIDNCSSYDIFAELELLIRKSENKISIIRNEINIGLSGNFLKAFEICKTKYLWILSDDDIPKENSISQIYSTLEKKDYSVLKYSSTLYRENISQELINKEDFLKYYLSNSQKKFSNLVFISNTVFNTHKIKKYIQYGYQYANTFAPHLSIIFHSYFLDKANTILIDNNELVEQVPPLEGRWTLFKVFLGFKSFEYIDVDFNKNQYKDFVQILRSCRSYYRSVFVELSKLGNQKGDYTYVKEVYKYLFFGFSFKLVDRFLMLSLYWCIDKPFMVKIFRKFIKKFDNFYSIVDFEKSNDRL